MRDSLRRGSPVRGSRDLLLERVDGGDLGPDELVAGLEAGTEPGRDRLGALGVLGRHRSDRALTPGVELLALETERLDALTIQDVLDGGADRIQGAANCGGAVGL